MQKRLLLSTLTLAIVATLGSVTSVRASTITAPAFTFSESGWAFSGVGFTANIDSSLTAFTFVNQGKADTVVLVDASGNVLNSLAIPSSSPNYVASVSWALTAGQQYYLLRTTLTNSRYANYGGSLPFNAEITMTDTGIFSLQDTSPFDIAGNGLWSSFTDITTSSTASAVPEPSTLLLLGMGLTAVAARLRRKSRT